MASRPQTGADEEFLFVIATRASGRARSEAEAPGGSAGGRSGRVGRKTMTALSGRSAPSPATTVESVLKAACATDFAALECLGRGG
jgi:hypothetical protein